MRVRVHNIVWEGADTVTLPKSVVVELEDDTATEDMMPQAKYAAMRLTDRRVLSCELLLI